ncbi:MAG TPA: response regulator [Ktedonobacterales bacterium]|jgi:DNA-binding NtrC family response regulator|nr:response regulator [Ktedonobacterales bacterium]
MDEGEQSSQAQRSALLLDNDLFFVAKISATLKHAGYTTRTARTLDAFSQGLAEKPDIALVNTAARGVDWRAGIVTAREAGIPVIAFGSHVDLETQAEARKAGATRVIANSKLATDLPGIVERAIHKDATQIEDEIADE